MTVVQLTGDEVGMVELAHGVRFEPGDLVAEKAIEDGVALLRQRPGVADVHLVWWMDMKSCDEIIIFFCSQGLIIFCNRQIVSLLLIL